VLINERENRRERLLTVANAMMTAARTAPKGKGIDIIEVAIATDETIVQLSQAMIRYSEQSGLKFFLRDAENILQAGAIVLIGTKRRNQNLNCSYCGFETCAAKDEFPEVPCAVNTVDVGIAIGSACSVAAGAKTGATQIPAMFSVGRAAIELGLLPGCTSVYGIPISSTSKNPFFDRVSKTPVQK
jgi:uncharacterized ferredoxin-like protein